MNPMAFEDVAAKYHQVNELFKNSEEKYGKIVAEEKKKAK